MKSSTEIRKKNIELLVKKYGSANNFAAVISKKPAQIYQILNDDKGLGNALARHIENTLGYPENYLDHEIELIEDPIDYYLTKLNEQIYKLKLSSEESQLIEMYRSLTKEQRKGIVQLIRSFKE